MSAARSCDAIVLGGGPNGLIAAAYLGRAGHSVFVLEAGTLQGLSNATVAERANIVPAHSLYALDPRAMADLSLARHGLRFAARDLALISLSGEGMPLTVHRDIHDTVAALAVSAPRDAENWPRFRRELLELGRALRSFWWDDSGDIPEAISRRLSYMTRTSAAAWLDSWFESDALKAALCFDATAGGVSVLEPGSALILVWRAAQEMSGLQGAVALPQGGMAGLMAALVSAAQSAGCEIRQRAVASRLLLDGDRVAGVDLTSGESIFAPVVLSAISQCAMLSMLPQSAVGIARTALQARRIPVLSEAILKVHMKDGAFIERLPLLAQSRCVLAERIETYVRAYMAARQGALAAELPMEITVPTLTDASLVANREHVLSILVRPIPPGRPDDEAFSSLLSSRVAKVLDSVMPGMSDGISGIEVFAPDFANTLAPLCVDHMLQPTLRRVSTPVSGLYLCGADAEPVPAISGSAARAAARLAGAKLR